MSGGLESRIDWRRAKERIALAQRMLDSAFEADERKTNLLLKARAETLAARGAVGATPAASARMLVFHMGGTCYALDVSVLDAVGAWQEVGPVPASGDSLIGLFSARGAIWALYDLARVLAIETGDSSPGGNLLFLRGMRRNCALRVDRLEGIASVDLGTLKEVVRGAKDTADSLVSGLLDNGILVIDSNRLRRHPIFSKGGLP